MREESYRVHWGRREGKDWPFAVESGMKVTDQMAIDSEPTNLAARELDLLARAKRAIAENRIDDAARFIESLESSLTLSRTY